MSLGIHIRRVDGVTILDLSSLIPVCGPQHSLHCDSGRDFVPGNLGIDHPVA